MSRREEILDALIDIFRSEGVGADFTISQLAARVDIGKSTIYEYFKTKEDIMSSALCRVFDESINAIFTRKIDESKSFEETYKEELLYLFSVAKDSQFLFNFLTPKFMKSFPDSTRMELKLRMKDVTVHYEKKFVDIFMKGVAEKIISEENSLINGILISSLVTGSIMRFANANVQVTNEVDLHDYIDALYKASVKIAN